jgi:hypothetical protein
MGKFNCYKTGDKVGECEFISYEGEKSYYYTNRSYAKKIGKFKCRCGKEFITLVNHVSSGNTTSCGCFNKERVKAVAVKHGLHKHPLYGAWSNMKSRCYCTSADGYEYYGGKGIKVCDEWRNSFVNYHDWMILNGWRRGLSLDRIDGNKDYCPENCRVATDKQQARNTKRNKIVEYNGEKMCLIELCEKLNLKYSTVCNRLRRNWTIEKAISIETKSEKIKRLNGRGILKYCTEQPYCWIRVKSR